MFLQPKALLFNILMTLLWPSESAQFDGVSGKFQDYLTRALDYSDDQAYRRLKAAQLMVTLPEVEPKLESGQLNLTQAANTQKSFEIVQKEQKTPITNEKKKEIIAAIEKANNHQTKSILASELNLKPEVDERIKPQSNQTVRLELNFTNEQFEKLQQVKGL